MAPSPGPAGDDPTPDLRPVLPDDLPFLYQVATRWPETWPRASRRAIPNPHEFEVLLWADVLAQYAVLVPTGRRVEIIGLVGVYGADHLNGTAQVESVGLPGDANGRVRAVALTMLIDRAFTTWSFRKLYGVHHGYEPPVFTGVPYAAHEEARLVEHVLHDGFHWDRITSAIHRRDWQAAR